MSRFVDPNNLKTIDLGNGEWVKIPSQFSFDQIGALSDIKSNVGAQIGALLVSIVKEWNIKNDEGIVPPVTPENIKLLDVKTIKIISEAVVQMIEVEKKV